MQSCWPSCCRTGIVGKGVLQMAQELLDPPGAGPCQRQGHGGLAASPGCCMPAPATWNASKAWAPPSAELVAVLGGAPRLGPVNCVNAGV